MTEPMLLGLTDEERASAGTLLTALLDDYERSLPGSHLVPEIDRTVLAELLATPIPAEGIGVAELFSEISGKILPNSTTVAHPRFLAYVQGPSNGIAPYAEAIAATINQNCNFWQLSPAASVLERKVLSWLAEVIGYPADAGGILTGGGSIATITGLATALDDRCPDFRAGGLQRQGPPLVVYTSAEAHRSVDKAAVVLGIGLDNVRHISVDERYRMRTDALAEAIAADRAAGLRPFCVVATSGTTTTGSIDPLDEIADLCDAEDLWLHVDGAYGALFLLGEDKHAELSGCARADSITLDPHKLLFAPLEAGCLLVRDREKLRTAFSFSSSYLTITEDPLMIDYMDYGPQLSRDFKALKIWSALRMFGVDRFRTAVQRTLDLARYLADRIAAVPGLDVIVPVSLTAVCFAIDGADGDRHTRVLAQLAREGTALLGPASVHGRQVMRACVTNYRTTYADLDLIVDRLATLVAATTK